MAFNKVNGNDQSAKRFVGVDALIVQQYFLWPTNFGEGEREKSMGWLDMLSIWTSSWVFEDKILWLGWKQMMINLVTELYILGIKWILRHDTVCWACNNSTSTAMSHSRKQLYHIWYIITDKIFLHLFLFTGPWGIFFYKFLLYLSLDSRFQQSVYGSPDSTSIFLMRSSILPAHYC